ncbi:MAG: DUF535 family protein [Hydrogenovibrio sp.]|uniref:DUF535 family protein n=1 Tax=Hydrogenovibrio sp. TaxID=2065821 RepID=UPI00287066B3|nr:DUF535 family protein [Hydrogenovibrio sp.]MDR9498553.1 DUF535 family protein [Hydrogenovibrio sp.]MDR9499217.1 DUF535 family protein [Hydrogenovibrio sp.]
MMKEFFVYWITLYRVFLNSRLSGKDRLKSIFWLAKKRGWVKALHESFQHHHLDDVLSAHAYLYFIFKRMYVFMHKDSRQTLEATDNHELIPAIVQHYAQLARHLPQPLIAQLNGGQIEIANTAFAPFRSVRVYLTFIHQNRREGLTSLVLEVDGQAVYYLNFLLTEKGALIGGVQGAKDSLELSRAFTKATQGIPPHKYLYIAVAALMAEWSVPAVYGIRHAAHVFQGEAKTQYKLENFNYDVFWQDVLEGEVEDDDWYQLSAPYQRKPLDDVNAKKRGKLKKRYPFMDALEANVREFAQNV